MLLFMLWSVFTICITVHAAICVAVCGWVFHVAIKISLDKLWLMVTDLDSNQLYISEVDKFLN